MTGILRKRHIQTEDSLVEGKHQGRRQVVTEAELRVIYLQAQGFLATPEAMRKAWGHSPLRALRGGNPADAWIMTSGL